MQYPIMRIAEKAMVTKHGTWREILYYDGRDASIALVYGAPEKQETVPLRIQSHCIAAFVFDSVECDCRDQMQMAQAYIRAHGWGVVIWLDQDGRGEGHLAWMLAAKLAASDDISESVAYARLGYPTDGRRYVTASLILHDLGVDAVELLSNNLKKRDALADHGVHVTSVRAIVPPGSEEQLTQKGLTLPDQTIGPLTESPP
jgi:GTP cyclohydrolase II